MSRRGGDAPICCHLSVVERDVVDAMKAMTGIASDADLTRLGLWHLARHLDVPIGARTFAPRRQKSHRRTA